MILLPVIGLPSKTQAALAAWQTQVMSAPSYQERVEAGKNLYKSRRSLKGFESILDALSKMCGGVKRCFYCEDSAATDIDHFWPKDYYPSRVFVWENYCYVCSRCNRFKSNVWDVYSEASWERVSVHEMSLENQEPPAGNAVMIDPRREDPLHYLRLDLKDTFEFKAHSTDGRDSERAEYTIRRLRLNEEDLLPVARRAAYSGYKLYLEVYVQRKRDNEPSERLSHIVQLINKVSHMTVWREMQRQQEKIPELKRLFSEVPEALDW